MSLELADVGKVAMSPPVLLAQQCRPPAVPPDEVGCGGDQRGQGQQTSSELAARLWWHQAWVADETMAGHTLYGLGLRPCI